MTSQRFRNPVFVALDTPDLDQALELGRSLKDYVGGLKIGLEFITAHGPEGVRAVVAIGLPVFADVKFHDIPNTVAAASRELARLGATIFNIHVSGGEVMMREAVAGARAVDPRVMVVGVLGDPGTIWAVDVGPLPAPGNSADDTAEPRSF